MNWTGGKLQRSKQANKGITRMQKAHFARARTQLQNTSDALTSPFHPPLFRDHEAGGGAQLPPFNASTARDLGPTRRLHERQGGASPALSQNGFPNETEDMVQRSSRRLKVRENVTTHNKSLNGETKRKRNAVDADPEESLLEARRQRLLRQQDWAGLTHSKPTLMRFPSRSEREKIGKRRKIKDGDALTMARKEHARTPTQEFRDRLQGPHTISGALPFGDIRVRIGTDALSELAPTQQASESSHRVVPSSSDASSDTMLFEYEEPHIATRSSLEQQDCSVPIGAYAQVQASPPQTRGEGLQAHRQAMELKIETSYRNKTCDAAHSTQAQNQHIPGPPTGETATYDNDKVSGCYITQRIGDVDRPLRLVVDRSIDCSSMDGEDAAGHGCTIGETNHGLEFANARLHEYGNQHDYSPVADQPRIVDDRPWRSYFAIHDSSSNRSAASEMDGMHSRRTLQTYNMADAESMPSQHAMRGGQTNTNSSSCILPSLPPAMRDCEGRLASDVVKKPRDEDEQLWRTFVFANEVRASSDLPDLNDEAAAMDTAGKTLSRRVTPHSLVARSLGSRRFQASERAGPVDNGAQDAATRVPRSTSPGSMLPMLNSDRSPSIRWRAQGRSESGEGHVTLQTAEDCGLGGETVTRTSLQNNASHSDSGSIAHSGDWWPQTSRAELHQGKGWQTGHDRAAQPKRDERASVYEIPVSDHVEADRLDLVAKY